MSSDTTVSKRSVGALLFALIPHFCLTIFMVVAVSAMIAHGSSPIRFLALAPFVVATVWSLWKELQYGR